MVPLFFYSFPCVPIQVNEVSVPAEVTHHVKFGGPSYCSATIQMKKRYRYKEHILRFLRKLKRERQGKELIE